MTDQHDPDKPVPNPSDKDLKDLTTEEADKLREERIKQRIEELRKRDPFIYR